MRSILPPDAGEHAPETHPLTPLGSPVPTNAERNAVHHGELKRPFTTRQRHCWAVGDVLCSGIYVLVGLVAAAVGGAFWMPFVAGVAIATITGLAHAELGTNYPQAAGVSLYINEARQRGADPRARSRQLVAREVPRRRCSSANSVSGRGWNPQWYLAGGSTTPTFGSPGAQIRLRLTART